MRTPSEGEDWQGEPTDDSEDDTDSSVDTNSSAAGASNGNWDEDGEGGEASNGHSTDGKHKPFIFLANSLSVAPITFFSIA